MLKRSLRWRLVVLAAWAAGCLVTTAIAGEDGKRDTRDKISWAVIDFPPFQILNGEYRGSGSFDGLMDLLVSKIDRVDHEIVPMSFARREAEMREGKPLCTPGIFRTPARDGYLVFSMPALIHLDNRLIYLARNADRFPAGPAIDLEQLFKRSDLVGGMIGERSFAPNIDALLRRQTGRDNLVVRPLRSTQIVEMLLNGEIDYTILFPHEVAFIEQQLGRQGQLASRAIVGTPLYIVTHVACTRGAWGEQAIARVDQVLRKRLGTPEYRGFSERWYADSDRAQIRQYYPQLLDAARRPVRR